jgi:hypothetical protein
VLNEEQAWKRLELWASLPRQSQERRDLGLGNCGLCGAINLLWTGRYISGIVEKRMRGAAISAYFVRLARAHKLPGFGSMYLAPCSDEGDKVRVRYCRRMAGEARRRRARAK